jgi:hypothetical protein
MSGDSSSLLFVHSTTATPSVTIVLLKDPYTARCITRCHESQLLHEIVHAAAVVVC